MPKQFSGKAMKKYRNRKGYTQRSLAEILEVRTATISDYENEHRTPDANFVGKLAHILGISVNDLYNGESEPELTREVA